MATLWWLGQTANGDVNIASNWTYYGPGTCGGFTMIPASNIPKYDDIVQFSKFTFNNGTYPIYPPIGDMRGLCGPAGNTAAQYFKEVRVNHDCPVTIGGSTAFGFRTSSLIIRKGTTAGPASDGYTTGNYIHLYDCSGVTKINATIQFDNQKQHSYSFTGVAAQLKIGFGAGSPPTGRNPQGKIYLANFELQGRTFSGPVDQIVLDTLNAAIFSYEPQVSFENQVGRIPQVTIYAYPTTTVTGNIYLEGREKIVIYKGFNLTSNTLFLANVGNSNNYLSKAYSQAEFITEPQTSLTGTGPDPSIRSYINKLVVVGDSTYNQQFFYLAGLPKVQLNHGVDINSLEFVGAGQIDSGQSQTLDLPRILRGTFQFGLPEDGQGIGTQDSPNVPQVEKIGFYSEYGPINYGSAGTFVWDNTDGKQILRSNLYGSWDYKITPYIQPV